VSVQFEQEKRDMCSCAVAIAVLRLVARAKSNRQLCKEMKYVADKCQM